MNLMYYIFNFFMWMWADLQTNMQKPCQNQWAMLFKAIVEGFLLLVFTAGRGDVVVRGEVAERWPDFRPSGDPEEHDEKHLLKHYTEDCK